MIKRSEGYFRGKNDFELFFQVWSPANPTATLVITHGLGEHTESYQRTVDGLMGENIRFIAWDMRGHGRSEGKRGVIQNFSDFCSDQELLIQYIRNEISEDPIGMLAHSLGGLVTLSTFAKNPSLDIKCAIMSSPLIAVQLPVPEIKRIGAKYLAQYLPNLTMWNEINDKDLTHDKSILTEFAKDPLRHDRVSPKLFLGMNSYMEKLKKEGGKIHLPILFQLAGEDKIVSTKAATAFFETIKSSEKEIKIYENSYHEIYNDIECNIAFADAKAFLQKYLVG